jgi:predicted cation transporter
LVNLSDHRRHKAKCGFFYLLKLIGIYVIPCIILLGIFGAVYIGSTSTYKIKHRNAVVVYKEETYSEIITRAAKIFMFVLALELLGAGLKPIVEMYIDSHGQHTPVLDQHGIGST